MGLIMNLTEEQIDHMSLRDIERLADQELARPEAQDFLLREIPGEIDMAGPEVDHAY